jgi:3-oxoacyl-[acyl-carrier protein] reductase
MKCCIRNILLVFSPGLNADLAGKSVLVTGASGGIGSAIARAFLDEGGRVIAHYHRRKNALAEFQTMVSRQQLLTVQADLTREADVKRLFSAAVKSFGRIDTVIANAASWEIRDVPLQQMTLQQWRKSINGVLTSTFLTLREFFKIVEKQRRGNAVVIASTAAVFGEAGHADYAAAKAAIAYGLTRSLKNELSRLAPHTNDYCGGRINCISPGWTIVPRLKAKLSDAKAVRKVTATMALPQLARPVDIANAAVFFASDSLARHLTGQNLVIAGGMEGRWLWSPEEVDPRIA